MHRLKWFVRTPRRAVATAVVAALVIPGAAFAAWVVFTGATGSSNGTYPSPTNGAAVTIINDGANGTVCDPSGCSPHVRVTNNAGVTESILPGSSQVAGAITFTTTPTECASHMTLNPAYAGQSIVAGASQLQVVLANLIKVDAQLPATCAQGSWTATYNLATSP